MPKLDFNDISEFLNQDLLNETISITSDTEWKIKPYSLGIFPEVAKGSRVVDIFGMESAKRDVNLHSQVGQEPVQVKPAPMKISPVEMAHVWWESSKSEHDYEVLSQQIGDYKLGKLRNSTGYDVYELVNTFYSRIFADNLKNLVDNKTFMFGQLLTNSNGCATVGDIHADKYSYTISGVTANTDALANLTANPISNITANILTPAAAKGINITDIWVGKDAAAAILSSPSWKMPIYPRKFDYTPAMANGQSVPAKNAQILFDLGGIDVVAINDVVTVAGTTTYPFNPKSIVGFNRNNFMEDMYAPTYRFKKYHPEKLSFYEVEGGKHSDKVEIFRSEGFYLTAILNAANLVRCTYTV